MTENDELPVIPTIENMNQFQERIKEWISLDNKINNYNKKLKTLRATRNLLSQKTSQYMDTNDQKDLVINIGDGKLKYFENRKKGIPSMSFLRLAFLDYFDNNEEKVQELITFLQNRLPVTEEKGLKRYYVKNNAE